MAARARDRDSAGRLLRVIADCDLYHMEAAIASLKHVKTGIRSESLLKPSGGDDVDVLERTAEGRVLSLSDHKRIARLQAALSAVANAYSGENAVEEPTESDSNRNLVRTVAGAAIMQVTRDCSASRTNCCILGSRAEKLLFLLDWMMNREHGYVALARLDRGYVQQLLLEWIQPSAEKQNQLAACLALFELLQRRRQRLTNSASGRECSFLLGDQVELYLEALRSTVERGTLPVADSLRVKHSKLALIAFETLVLLCGDVAAYYSSTTDAAKITLAGGQLMKYMVESAQFAVVELRQWHLHSTRRQFLGYALLNLQSYTEICKTLEANVTGLTSDAVAGLDVLCWHWCATASLLCTRSDVSSLIKKNQPHEVLARLLRRWTADALNNKLDSGRRRMATNPELVYSQLRYVCLLMDAAGGIKACSKAFEGFPVDMKASFVFFFVYGLSVANKSGDEAALQLTLNVLRAVLLPSDPLHLLSSRDEEQELLSQLLREVGSDSIARTVSHHDSQAQTELELFVVDFIISRKLVITDLVMWMQDSHSKTIQSALSLTRTFLYQLDRAAFQEPLYRHWRQVLSPVVLALLNHTSHRVHRLVISCLPSLDHISCIAGLCTAGVLQAENNTVTSALGYLLNTSTQHSLEIMVAWFIDASQYGSSQLQLISKKSPVSPHEWSDYAAEQSGNAKARTADDEDRKEQQEQLLSLCFGRNGWSIHVRSSNARSQVLSILLRKIFGSPRDTLLLRMLREFVGCGWVDRHVFGTLEKQLTSHMMNLQRLTEDTLNDNSASAAKTVEGLLFSRLAPLLVLRMLPRDIFGAHPTQALLCEGEDLDHLNEFIVRQQHLDDRESQTADSTCKILCHILALSVVDPLEFKEVKMLATEALAKLPPPKVVPFVFAHLLAFLREADIYRKDSTSLIVSAESIPEGCVLVTAKLMVYYLNRVFAEDDHAYKDQEITMKNLVVLVQIMGIPCTQDPGLAGNTSLLADLQRGCIDCVGLILARLDTDDKPLKVAKTPTASASSLVNLLLTWIFEAKRMEKTAENYEPRVQELLQSLWSEAQHDELPLQVRICCCNVLLSAISRLEDSALERWKSQGFISRVAVATESCFEEDVVAGGLQIIFSFLYKSSELLSVENSDDVQLVRNCFDATVSRLESTRSESVAMSGLKVVGALVGKLPNFVGTLPPAEVQRLIDGCLISLRDRRLSPVVSELAQSLLQAMTPP